MEQAMIRVQFVPNVETGEVEPFLPQYGGVQGDRNAATVSFAVPESLQGDTFRYRIEGEDGAGGFVTTAPLPLDDDGCVVTLLDERFTAAGGQILVRLVVSEVQNGNEVTTVRSFDGRLFFADAPSANVASPFRDTLSALLARNEEKLERMNATAAALSEQVGEFNARVGASEGMLMSHGTRLTAAEQTTAALSGQMSECGARVTANEGTLANHGTRLTAAETALTTAETALAAAESRLTADEQTAEELDGWVQRIYDNLENLEGLAEMKENEPTPWQFIQKIVRAGLAEKLFSVGDLLTSEHADYGTIVWEVVGFDHYEPLDERFSHSMTLQTKECLHRADGHYDLKVWDAPSTAHANGYSLWETSDLRVWLNSDDEGGEWFVPEDEDATPPEYAAQDGFARGFSKSFLDAVGTIETPVAMPSGSADISDTTFDKFFLPSCVEAFGSGTYGSKTPNQGTVLEKYGAGHSSLSVAGNGADSNRVKKLNGTAATWWTRSVHPLFVDKVARISDTGTVGMGYPKDVLAVAPMCCIY